MRVRRAFRGLGDLDTSSLGPLLVFQAQWTQALANQDAAGAAAALSNGANVAETLARDARTANATASYLGDVASEAGQLAGQASSGDLSFVGSDTLANLNATVNLLGRNGQAYVTGANVTSDASAEAAAGIASQQATLRQRIAAFQAGSVWNPSEILGVSAERLAPLLDAAAAIDATIRNASLNESDRANVQAAQGDIVRVLGGKVAASDASGTGPGAILNCLTNPGGPGCGTICALLGQPLQWMCQNPGKTAAGALGLLLIVRWSGGRR